MQYTSVTDPNTPAAFGQSGANVSAYQQQLNDQHSGTPGYVPLAVDGKYGPLTQAASVSGTDTTNVIKIYDVSDGSNSQVATVTVDSTNMTLVWTKVGSGTTNISVMWEAEV